MYIIEDTFCQKEQTLTDVPISATPFLPSAFVFSRVAKVHTVHQVVDHPKHIYVGEKVHVYDVVHKVACLVEKKNVGRVVTDSQLKVSEKSIKTRNGSDELRAIHSGFNQRILVWMA